jgi:hypothetical protein
MGMADKKGLRIFGFALGGVTIAVALVAALTVQAHSGMTPGPVSAHTLTLSR